MFVGDRDGRGLGMKAGLLLNPGHFLDRRGPDRGGSRAGIARRLARHMDQKRDAVDPLAPRQPGVERQLCCTNRPIRIAGGQADGQAGDIDEAEQLVTETMLRNAVIR